MRRLNTDKSFRYLILMLARECFTFSLLCSKICLVNGWTEALKRSGRDDWIFQNILLEANMDLSRWDKSDSISVATNSIISCFTYHQGY